MSGRLNSAPTQQAAGGFQSQAKSCEKLYLPMKRNTALLLSAQPVRNGQ